MEISYLGQACFKVKTKEVVVTIDPFNPKFEADIICVTRKNSARNVVEGVAEVSGLSGKSGGPFVIDGPGEYEVKGVTIFGIPAESGEKNESKEQMTLYSFEIEDFTLAHLGSIGIKLNDEQVSELEGMDVLMVPVGGITNIGHKQASEIVEQVAPSIVIPMLYSDSASVEKFFEEMQVEAPEAVEKLKLKFRADLPEEREVVLLKMSNV